MPYAFITSTGRTGTDFFTTLFNELVENAWSLHEPRPAFRRRARELLARPPKWSEVARFALTRRWWHVRRPEEWYVETNYHLFAAVPLIRRAFPEGKVIHIVRDGRDVVTSWLNRWRYITNDHIRARDVPADPAAEHWESWNPLQKLAWYWVTVNRRAERTQPDLVVRFEDIFKGEREGAFRILDELEELQQLQYDPEAVEQLLNRRVNPNPVQFFPRYPEWPRWWKEQFWEIAGEEMQRWGYAE